MFHQKNFAQKHKKNGTYKGTFLVPPKTLHSKDIEA